MRLSEPLLRESIAAHRASAEPGTRAEIDNIWFEERVNDRRQGVFEGTLGGVTGWDELRRRHVDYHRTFV